MKQDIKSLLLQQSEEEYRNFNKKIIATNRQMLGVRLPALKRLAKEIDLNEFTLDSSITHEEVLLFGYVAAKAKTEQEQLAALKRILPYIDNWCTCDCIVGALKKLSGETSFTYFKVLTKSKSEFEVRVGLIGLMKYFLLSKTSEVLQITREINFSKYKEPYYVKMAASWLLCELAISNFPLAFKEISKARDDFVKNKAISKCCDSFRLTQKQKQALKNLR